MSDGPASVISHTVVSDGVISAAIAFLFVELETEGYRHSLADLVAM